MDILHLVVLSVYAIIYKGSGTFIQRNSHQADEAYDECGRNLTLTCMFTNGTSVIVWKNADDITPIARCIQNVCDLDPRYDGQYTTSFDSTRFIFNLTIIKATMKDNGRKLVCSDGSNTDSHVIRVRDYEPVLLEDTQFGTITAISGCISNSTNVLFKWKKIYTGSTIEEEIIPKFRTPYKSSCSDDFECGDDQQVKYTEIVISKPNENGNYFLKIEAIYGNESKESFKTATKYIIEEQDEKEVKAGVKIIGISAAVVGVVAVGFAFVGVLCVILRQYRGGCKRNLKMKKKKPTKKGSDENKNEESLQFIPFKANETEITTNEVVVCLH